MKLTKTKATTVTTLAAAAVMMLATAAHATTTVSVGGTTTPPGAVAVTGTTTGSISFLTNFGVPATCTSGTSGGTILRGASAVAGTKVGSITSMTFSSCLATSLNFPVNMTKKVPAASWDIYSIATPAKGAATISVEIRNVDAQMLSTTTPYNCAANATGTVRATINTTTDRLIIDTTTLAAPYNRPLTLDALPSTGVKPNTTTSSCGGEIQDGDLASMKGTFQLNQDVAIS